MSRAALTAVFLLTAAVSPAQTKEPGDAWLMRNYHFVEGPAPGEIRPVSPAMAQLEEIQNTLLNILRKANFAGDYEAALAAAAQAAANARLMGTLTGEWKPLPPPRGASTDQPRREPPVYLVAFKNQPVQEATAVWRDNLMLHYKTRQGAHEQVRLDLVDWKLSTELNRARGLSVP